MKKTDVDVVVLGTGNAALCAAIAAKEQGASVCMLERAPKSKRGGNSYFTDGAIRCAYGRFQDLRAVLPDLDEEQIQQISMPDYGEEAFMADLLRLTDGQTDKKLANQLVSRSFDTIQWMMKQGVQFTVNENQYYEKDGKRQFWGGLPLKTKNKGVGLVQALFQRAEALGIDIKYDAKTTALKQEDQLKKLIVEIAGESVEITANAVIFACGGFEANANMRKTHLGNEWEKAVVRGTAFNTGEGLTLALKAGAVRYGQWDGCHAHTTDYHAPKTGNFNKPGDIYKKSSYPLGLIVNVKGERFVDEGADFRNYTYAKYGKETLKQPEQKAFQLFDAQVSPNLRKEYHLPEATCYKADSVEELAEKMGVCPESLANTICAYNQAVQPGPYNPAIKDGKCTKGVCPPKSNWALTFEKAPFYAFPVTCGITFTFGGIHVSPESEILGDDKRPIDGLFAAGEMVGGLFYHNYPGGSGLMAGAVFGRLAGEQAATFCNRTKPLSSKS
ncbi:tricarballylate dehydrogenase [Shouchella clausii]|uniref:FAD-dependent tricarballylate dehydrogenase TcuA n=1 Tax=Shouchella clausii TaxID=79880 RepID=UPI000BA5585F|nr:FAD-dependent tricarballylate dehydrogenase TcuA [Shouchella clausii]PAF08914.1 tricarballylate dehydrogenase [Shouchella clausii]